MNRYQQEVPAIRRMKERELCHDCTFIKQDPMQKFCDKCHEEIVNDHIQRETQEQERAEAREMSGIDWAEAEFVED